MIRLSLSNIYGAGTADTGVTLAPPGPSLTGWGAAAAVVSCVSVLTGAGAAGPSEEAAGPPEGAASVTGAGETSLVSVSRVSVLLVSVSLTWPGPALTVSSVTTEPGAFRSAPVVAFGPSSSSASVVFPAGLTEGAPGIRSSCPSLDAAPDSSVTGETLPPGAVPVPEGAVGALFPIVLTIT